MNPRTRAIISSGQIQQRPAVHECGKHDPRFVKGETLERAAIGANAPDVHLIRWKPANEIDEGTIRRPHFKVIVDARVRNQDLPGGSLLQIAHEHRIAGAACVIHEPPAIGRPVSFRGVGSIAIHKRAELTANRRHRPAPRLHTARRIPQTNPQRDERSIRREGHVGSREISEIRRAAVREIAEAVGPNLTHPGIPRTRAIGDERDELPVAGNRDLLLGRVPICQPRERGSSKRIA